VNERIAFEHLDVIRTLLRCNMIDKEAATYIRHKVQVLQTFTEREAYLKEVIKSKGAAV